jgi:hypothetical protein
MNVPRKSPKLISNLKIALVGGILLAFTLSVSVVSTLAWFDISNNLILNDMDIQFAKNEKFELGLKKDNEITYYTDVTSDILSEYNDFYRDDQTLATVTSAYESTWLNSSTNKATALPQFRAGPYDDSIAEGGYFQFEFYVRTNRDAYVYLSPDTTLTSDHSKNQNIARKYRLNADQLDHISKCARVSFYSEEYGYTIYEPNVAQSSQTPLAGRLDLKPADGYFDNDGTKELMFGEYNKGSASLIYDDEARINDIAGEASCFNAKTADGVAALDVPKSIKEGNLKIATEKTYSLSELTPDEEGQSLKHPLLYAPLNEPTRLVVTVYVEGWDYDTISSVASGYFNLDLKFSAFFKTRA